MINGFWINSNEKLISSVDNEMFISSSYVAFFDKNGHKKTSYWKVRSEITMKHQNIVYSYYDEQEYTKKQALSRAESLVAMQLKQ